METRQKLNIKLHQYSTLKVRIEIAKENNNTKELEQLHSEYEKWNNVIEEVAKTKPNQAYTLNAYYLENKSLAEISVALKNNINTCNSILYLAKNTLIDTKLWKEL